jgi:GT2 family glycosyltransferase
MNQTAVSNQQNNGTTGQPSVWVVTLGFNNAGDSIACLKSLAGSEGVSCSLLFADNNSRDDSVARVLAETPSVRVIETGSNLGFARGFNVGIDYCLRQGADYVFMINNDTVVAPDCLARLVAEAQAHSEAGILVPKIFYHDHPRSIWSAGSRFRRFPPAIVMRKTKGDDDGRFDRDPRLEYTTTCALLLSRAFLEKVGLMDRDYFILFDDYDWSVRARDQGCGIRLVPDAHLWHKVSKSTGVGTRSPFFWTNYGKSAALFFRKHARHRWLTGWPHLLYLLARILAEGTYFGLIPFLKGWREGRRAEMHAPPRPLRDETDAFTVVRG